MKKLSLLAIGMTLLFLTVNAKSKTHFDKEVIIQDDSLLVAFDAGTGALVRMERKSTHWLVERRP